MVVGLDGLTADGLNRIQPGRSPRREVFLGTLDQRFSILALRPAIYRGRVADAGHFVASLSLTTMQRNSESSLTRALILSYS